MTRGEKIERKVIVSLNRLVRDEAVELGKTKQRRSRCYQMGLVLTGVSLYVSLVDLWPAWVTTIFGSLGGLGFGLGIWYDNSINQWPALKQFINGERLAEAAARYDS
jgi:hypothetical protein